MRARTVSCIREVSKITTEDGIGDLNGITSKLEHIADIGADALWLSPIYTSPQFDFGYDISNYTDVDKDYSTLTDFDKLVARAKSLGLKVILDFVPNHSSHQHERFKKSVLRIKPYDEYYVWRDAKIVNGTRKPPNNWLSVGRGVPPGNGIRHENSITCISSALRKRISELLRRRAPAGDKERAEFPVGSRGT